MAHTNLHNELCTYISVLLTKHGDWALVVEIQLQSKISTTRKSLIILALDYATEYIIVLNKANKPQGGRRNMGGAPWI